MKKVLNLMLVAFVLFTFTSCNDSAKSETKTTATTTQSGSIKHVNTQEFKDATKEDDKAEKIEKE